MGDDLQGFGIQNRGALNFGDVMFEAFGPMGLAAQLLTGQIPFDRHPLLNPDVQHPQNREGLGQVARVLDRLTGKADNIRQSLGDDLAGRLENRLRGLSYQDRDRVEQLLHFAWHSRGSTNAQSRQKIRVVLASFIANGGDLNKAATLKGMLKSKTATDASRDSLYALRTNGDALKRAVELQCLTGKGGSIVQHLHADVGERLRGRLQDMTTQQRQEVKSLLHFAWHTQGNTTAESRLKIRTVLAGYIANGGNLANAAQLKALLKDLPNNTLNNLHDGLRNRDVFLPGHLADSLLVEAGLDGDRAKTRFAALRPILEGFPRDANRANSTEFVGVNSLTLRRNAHGDLKVDNVLVKFTNVPRPLQRLTREQLTDIRNRFMTIIRTKFSRMGPSLEFMRYFRAQRQENPALTVAQAFRDYRPDGINITDTYQRGNCHCLASKIKPTLQHLGINSFISGQLSLDRIPLRLGNHNFDQAESEDLLKESGGITHLDVLVPYVDEDGNEHVLMLVPGLGPSDDYFKDMTLQDFQTLRERRGTSVRVQVDENSADVVSMDSSRHLKSTMSYTDNLQMRNDEYTDEHLFGIDLVGGTLYLNGRASGAYTGARRDGDAPDARVIFNYRTALAEPDAEIVLNVPNEDDDGVTPTQMTNRDALRVFLTAIAIQFNMPNHQEFVADTLTLMENEAGFKAAAFSQTFKTVLGI